MPQVATTFHNRILTAMIGAAAVLAAPLAAEEWRLGAPLRAPEPAGAHPASPLPPAVGLRGLTVDSRVAGAPAELQSGGRGEQGGALRLNAGYAFGSATGYIALGSQRQHSAAGAGSAPVIGFGMRVSLNRALQLSGEILHHEGDGSQGAGGGRGETLSLQAAFRF